LLAYLVRAYARREQWRARVQATALVNALGEALGGMETERQPVTQAQGEGLVRSRSGKMYRRVSADAALALCR
jgi:hypothetical protein